MTSLSAVSLSTTPIILQTPPNLCLVNLVRRIGGLPQFPPKRCIEFLPRGFLDLAQLFLGALDSFCLTLGNRRTPWDLTPSHPDPERCFLPASLLSGLTHGTGSLWISKLAKTKPKGSLSFDHCALDLACHWVAHLISRLLLKLQFQFTHRNLQIDLATISWKWYQEALFCFFFWGGGGGREAQWWVNSI